MNHGEMNTGDLFKNREMDTGETTILKLVPDFELAMETKERKEEMKVRLHLNDVIVFI